LFYSLFVGKKFGLVDMAFVHKFASR
jgi:hypothetical protein